MLVLTRKLKEKIQIGEGITVTILRVKGNSVRIGVEAPHEIRILRAELSRENWGNAGDARARPSDGECSLSNPDRYRSTGDGIAPSADVLDTSETTDEQDLTSEISSLSLLLARRQRRRRKVKLPQ